MLFHPLTHINLLVSSMEVTLNDLSGTFGVGLFLLELLEDETREKAEPPPSGLLCGLGFRHFFYAAALPSSPVLDALMPDPTFVGG